MIRASVSCWILLFAAPANASPLPLICSGSITMDGKTAPIESETALLDIEAKTFKPPMYQPFPLTKVSESDISFGSELPSLSTWGSLDRISGTLSMNVMRPEERGKLQGGGTARFLVFLTAKCAPAKRLF